MFEHPFDCPSLNQAALGQVMQVVDLIANRPDINDDEIINSLVFVGVHSLNARLLTAFVPCALSFSFLSLLGLQRIPSTYFARDVKGAWIEFPLAEEPLFVTALHVGFDVTKKGYSDQITKTTFQAVTSRSAEMDCLNNLLNSGGSIAELAGAIFEPPKLYDVFAEDLLSRQP